MIGLRDPIEHELEPAVTLPWLVRLRWAFLVGWIVLLVLVDAWFQLAVSVPLAAIGIAGMAISNVALAIARRRGKGRDPAVIGAVMVLDTALLTILLIGSGGSANPFTALYLVHVTLSAIVLRAWWTVVIAALSIGGFALLFATDGPHAHHVMQGGAGFDRHLQAMWAAFALAAALIAFFVGRVSRAIARQRAQIAALRESNERNGRLASLTRLAAGAAHELGSPLATIAIAAHEARRRPDGAGAAADLELIAQEVLRCQDILRRMAARAARADEDEPITVAELSNRVRDLLGEERAQQVEVVLGTDRGAPIALPAELLAESIAALVKNAIEASREGERVIVRAAHDGGLVRIEIEDRGAGIPSELFARVGEPFFTTKEPGRGLGLGVFLARAFLESRRGSLELSSTPGAGTRAVIRLPAEARP